MYYNCSTNALSEKRLCYLFAELAKEQKELAKRKEERKKKKMKACNKHKNDDKELDCFNDSSFYQVTNLVVKTDEINDKGAETEDTASEKRSWTQNEELALIRLTNEYPGGFPNRWPKIAQILGRSVTDVAAKASEIANNLSSRTLINRKFCSSVLILSLSTLIRGITGSSV